MLPECLLAIPSLSSPRTRRFRPLQRSKYGRILEPVSVAWPGRLDYIQQPLASSANRRATGRPPGVASVSICFPDADPTTLPRDRPLHSQARADGPNKMPKMSAMPPDKRFAYWDCAPALPSGPAMGWPMPSRPVDSDSAKLLSAGLTLERGGKNRQERLHAIEHGEVRENQPRSGPR